MGTTRVGQPVFYQVQPDSNTNCMSGVEDNNGNLNPGGFDQLENGGSTTQGFASTSIHIVQQAVHNFKL